MGAQGGRGGRTGPYRMSIAQAIKTVPPVLDIVEVLLSFSMGVVMTVDWFRAPSRRLAGTCLFDVCGANLTYLTLIIAIALIREAARAHKQYSEVCAAVMRPVPFEGLAYASGLWTRVPLHAMHGIPRWGSCGC